MTTSPLAQPFPTLAAIPGVTATELTEAIAGITLIGLVFWAIVISMSAPR